MVSGHVLLTLLTFVAVVVVTAMIPWLWRGGLSENEIIRKYFAFGERDHLAILSTMPMTLVFGLAFLVSVWTIEIFGGGAARISAFAGAATLVSYLPVRLCIAVFGRPRFAVPPPYRDRAALRKSWSLLKRRDNRRTFGDTSESTDVDSG
jgi:hypothetical protein